MSEFLIYQSEDGKTRLSAAHVNSVVRLSRTTELGVSLPAIPEQYGNRANKELITW